MIRILLVEDHPLFRSGIKACLLREEDISVIGEADNELDALDIAKKESPDIILMDITLKKSDGIEATEKILNHNPNIKIIILSSHIDFTIIKRAIKSGAKGYLPKEILDENLITAIRTVMSKKLYFDQTISNSFLIDYAKDTQSGSKSIDILLNQAEKDVFFYLLSGDEMKEIARKMKVSTPYLSKVRNSIFEKIGVNSLVELIRFAMKEGLLPP